MKELSKFIQSLAFNQSLKAFLISLLVSIVLITTIFFWNLRGERESFELTMWQAMALVDESAIQAAYHLDEGLAERVVHGLIDYPYVIEVTIQDNFGAVLASKKTYDLSQRSRRIADFIETPESTYEIELTTEDFLVGYLQVRVDSPRYMLEQIQKILAVTLFLLFGVLFFTIILILTFHFSLTKPLLVLGSELSKVDPSNLAEAKIEVPRGHKKDELGGLVVSIRELISEFDSTLKEKLRVEERIKKSLAEKEILIKEIHHRVKNNLQVISSLLSLQADKIVEPRDTSVFLESQSRIKTMALVHEELYSSDDLSRIEFSKYAEKLIDRIIGIYSGVDHVGVIIDSRNIYLQISSAIVCGLILNELVTNSLKYAFYGSKEPRISVKVTENAGDVELVYRDNGVGISQEVDFERTETLGLKLIRILTQQLGGNVLLNRGNGTEYIFNFATENILRTNT